MDPFKNRTELIELIIDGAGLKPGSELPAPRPEGDNSEPVELSAKEKEETRSLIVKKLLGAPQAMPPSEALKVYCELAAKYLPALAESFRKDEIPNSASLTILNTISTTPYFIRFTKTPAGADLLDLHWQRMAATDPLKSDDDYAMSVAEACQFLSTLLVLLPFTASYEDSRRLALVAKLKRWRTIYAGKFCAEVAQRCLDIIQPEGVSGGHMFLWLPRIASHLEKGVETCNVKDCLVGAKKGEKKSLLQCAKCKTVRYCGVAHQKKDWPNHKHYCFTPVF